MALSQQEVDKIQGLTKNFQPHEFQCPCCQACNMDTELLSTLQKLRSAIKIPLFLNSAFRCERHNNAVGGKPNSLHLVGKAIDISLNETPIELRHSFLMMCTVLFNGVGVAKHFIHVDVRDKSKAAFWVY